MECFDWQRRDEEPILADNNYSQPAISNIVGRHNKDGVFERGPRQIEHETYKVSGLDDNRCSRSDHSQTEHRDVNVQCDNHTGRQGIKRVSMHNEVAHSRAPFVNTSTGLNQNSEHEPCTSNSLPQVPAICPSAANKGFIAEGSNHSENHMRFGNTVYEHDNVERRHRDEVRPSFSTEFDPTHSSAEHGNVEFEHFKIHSTPSPMHINEVRSQSQQNSQSHNSNMGIIKQGLDQKKRNFTSSYGSDYESLRKSAHDIEKEHADNNNVEGLRKSTRQRRLPAKFSDYELLYSEEAEPELLLSDQVEPTSFKEACKASDSNKWQAAMQEEMDSLLQNKTWDLVPLPPNRKALKNRWIYRLKDEGKNQKRYKARLVVKGFDQKKGIDFNEIFSPVVKMTTIRAILGLVAAHDLELEQLDVKTTFLHGDLNEEIYMMQPEGFIKHGKENLYCRLRKSLYGLKQAPRQWYLKFDQFMTENNFIRCESDPCVYYKKFPDGSFILLLLYVDDMLVTGSSMKLILELKEKMSRKFAMKDLGAAKRIFGMDIIRDRHKREIKLSQEHYVLKVLDRFGMADAKPVSTPLADHFKLSLAMCPKTQEEQDYMKNIPYSSAVGSLMYAMVCTRPDIAQAVGVVSRFMSNPGKQHWDAVKWILRYLKGTSDFTLCFGDKDTTIRGYTDSDMAGNLDNRRSTTGYVFTFAGAAISWASKLQQVVSLSTTEAEYIALTEAAKELIWLQRLFSDFDYPQQGSALYCDSKSAIDLAKNAVFHSRTKHIEVRYHFIRSKLDEGKLQVLKINTKDNPADALTKVVPREKFEFCRASLGIIKK